MICSSFMTITFNKSQDRPRSLETLNYTDKKIWLPSPHGVSGVFLYKRTPGPTTKFFAGPLSLGLAAILTIEPLYATCSVDQLLLAGEKRMATRAYFQPYFVLGRPRFPGLSTSAMHDGFHVFRMNVRLHLITPLKIVLLSLTYYHS